MVCLDFLTLCTSHIQPINDHPHSMVLTVIDHCSDINATHPPREHLRPSILEPITWDSGGLLRLFICFFPYICNIANLFLVFPTAYLPHIPFPCLSPSEDMDDNIPPLIPAHHWAAAPSSLPLPPYTHIFSLIPLLLSLFTSHFLFVFHIFCQVSLSQVQINWVFIMMVLGYKWWIVNNKY